MAAERRPRIVIVGGGFAGFHCARKLLKMAGSRFEIVLINTNDYFLYLPLLPQVAGGLLEPRRVAVSLAATLRGARLIIGQASAVDLDARTVTYTDPDGRRDQVSYDRLVLSAGSVNKLLPIPGLADHAHGFRGIPEALFLRDHLIRQIELAAATDDTAERDARLTFVVVGAGYTGTEVAAHGQILTSRVVKAQPRLAGQRCRWMLLDTAEHPLPGLAEHLSRTTTRVLSRRGMELEMKTSVHEAMADGVRLSDGRFIATQTLIWCVGVRPDPFLESLGLPTDKGRLVVDEYLNVTGHPEIFACGDAAAVPDLTMPGQVTAMTAQHAERHGKQAAKNIVASFGVGKKGPYKHHDLGFTVDLGGLAGAANPLQIPLAGPPAALVTAGYHLLALPANRVRVAADWILGGVSRQPVQLFAPSAPLETATPAVSAKTSTPAGS
jgi:NADH dehydrogenase